MLAGTVCGVTTVTGRVVAIRLSNEGCSITESVGWTCGAPGWIKPCSSAVVTMTELAAETILSKESRTNATGGWDRATSTCMPPGGAAKSEEVQLNTKATPTIADAFFRFFIHLLPKLR